MRLRVMQIVGARPNFMKIAPIVRALEDYDGIEQVLVHTGQHYDVRMSEVFFSELDLPRPDLFLNVGSGSHAAQTAKIMVAFEKVLLRQKPDIVLVVGDVNSTMACAITAAKLQIPVNHVEAGLRSFNRAMPEEINRVITDALSDLLLTTEESAKENLLREGIQADRIHFVGNVMIDTLKANLQRARTLDTLSDYGLTANGYALLTLHRPSNVDEKEILSSLLNTLARISEQVPILFPCHPRTLTNIKRFELDHIVKGHCHFHLCEPFGYLSFLNVMANARFVLTDSGGIQEETTSLGIPCLTLREDTERPITLLEGTNTLVGTDPRRICDEVATILAGRGKEGRIPEKWDGKAGERIAEVLTSHYLI